ncbi:MAG: V-type ATP synthase subunit I [Candidatus Helarchaeota archaeon]
MSIIIPKDKLDILIEKIGELKNFQLIHPAMKPYYHSEELSENFLIRLNELKRRINTFLFNYKSKTYRGTFSKYILKGHNLFEIYNKISEEFSQVESKYNKYKERILQLNEKVDKLNFLKIVFQKFLDLDIDLSFLKHLNYINMYFGMCLTKNIDNLEKSFKEYNLIFYYIPISHNRSFFIVIFNPNITSTIYKILKDYQATFIEDLSELEIDKINMIKSTIEKYNDEITDYNHLLELLLEQNYIKINSFFETLHNIEQILNIRSRTQFTRDFAYLEGWLIEKNKDTFVAQVHRIADKKVIIYENEVDEDEVPPSLSKYPPVVRSFGIITNLYGTPSYNEIDPTFLIAFTFPILFGLMFGDVGHGIVLIIGGIFAFLFLKLKPTYKNLSIIITVNGVSSVFAGFLYGEFFGYQFTPLLFDPFYNTLMAMKFSILIGLIFVCSGIIIAAINYIKKGEVIDVFIISIPKLVLFISCVYIVFVYGIDFYIWFSGPIYVPFISLLVLLFGRIILKLLFPSKFLKKTNKGEVFSESFLESTETVISVISNLISFTRIFVLSMIHISFMIVIEKISNLFGFLSLTFFIIGNGLVIIFELLMVLSQALRLHYYEWFTKFYEGQGIRFVPFSLQNKYSAIKLVEIS